MTRGVVPAFVLPVLLTLVTPAAVAWNRSSGRGPIVLSEREVSVSRRSDDNTTTSANVQWAYRPLATGGAAVELLQRLGSSETRAESHIKPHERDRRPLPRRAWVVFELDGPAYAALPPDLRDKSSRLVPIDASTDSEALIRKYPDASRHLIVAGVVDRSYELRGKDTELVAVVVSIDPRIHIPRTFAAAARGDRFHIAVMYGRRFEPWVVSVSR